KKNARFFSGSILLSTSLVGTLALSIIMLVSAIIISKYIDYAVIFVLVFYVLSSLLGFNFTFKWLINYLKHRNGKASKGLLNYIQTLSKFRGVFSQRYILLMLLAFLPTLILEGSLIYFILVAENQSISFIAALFIFSFSDLIGLITLSPSGIGSMDAVLILLLLAEGVPGAVTISTDLLFRLFQFFLPALQGYLSIPFIRRYRSG
ncbi:MAG: flippase-like domain-containing protein, partial [Nanoarchaeota archaeon]|nr:flippase-like domain-containing protein [Nanoarchaeota archaeon]